MDNAQKAIMIGVGLFITIIIIAAVMLITGMGQNLLNKGQAQVSGISESLLNDLTAQYDGKQMSGSQVRTAAVQLLNNSGNPVNVHIREKQIGGDYIVVDYDNSTITGNSNGTSLNSEKDKTNAINKYLSGRDSETYIGQVKYVEDKKVVCIAFVKKGVTGYTIPDNGF